MSMRFCQKLGRQGLLGSRAGQLRSIATKEPRILPPYPVEKGVGKFLSPKVLKAITTEWQGGLLDRLEDVTRSSKLADLSIPQVFIQSASDPAEALAFQYSSHLINTHFFLSNLNPEPTTLAPNTSLYGHLSRSSYLSLEGLQSYFTATALGLSPTNAQVVWFVTDAKANLAVFTTYGSGSLLGQAGKWLGHLGDDAGRLGLKSKVVGQPVTGTKSNESDESEPAAETEWSGAQKTPVIPTLSVARPNNLATLKPLFCLPLYPQFYVHDYGLWGREKYIQNFWNALDWNKVSKEFEAVLRVTTKQ